MTAVSIEYYGMNGSGKNLTEAKRNAGAKIERALEGTYWPSVISFKGWLAFIYRDPVSGWWYQLLSPEEQRNFAIKATRIHGTTNYDEFEDAVRHARSHLAQCLIDPSDTMTYEHTNEVILNDADRKEHAYQCNWQLCYRTWSNLGKDDNECREHAWRNEWPS